MRPWHLPSVLQWINNTAATSSRPAEQPPVREGHAAPAPSKAVMCWVPRTGSGAERSPIRTSTVPSPLHLPGETSRPAVGGMLFLCIRLPPRRGLSSSLGIHPPSQGPKSQMPWYGHDSAPCSHHLSPQERLLRQQGRAGASCSAGISPWDAASITVS